MAGGLAAVGGSGARIWGPMRPPVVGTTRALKTRRLQPIPAFSVDLRHAWRQVDLGSGVAASLKLISSCSASSPGSSFRDRADSPPAMASTYPPIYLS